MAHLEGQERALYVQDMFARIAGRYDLMNRLDDLWARYPLAQICDRAGAIAVRRPIMLDIATGTGEIALEGFNRVPGLQAVGGDFTIEMMQAGKRIPERQSIRWVGADTLRLPFPDCSFHAVTSGFLMRNVIDVKAAFEEQMRVTKPGGWVVVLESSPPKNNLLRPFILFHLNIVIPALGRLVTGEIEAYRYLPDSTQQFRDPEGVAAVMCQVGYLNVCYRLFMFGTIAIHSGQKPWR